MKSTMKQFLLGLVILPVVSQAQWNSTPGNVFLNSPANFVGIGTATPQGKLDVSSGDVYLRSMNGGITQFTNPNGEEGLSVFSPFGGLNTNRADIRFNGQSLKLGCNTGISPIGPVPNNNLMFMTTAGNFGIGIATPSSKFEINSNLANTSGLKFTQLNGGSPLGVSSGSVLTLNAAGEVVLVNDSIRVYAPGTGISFAGNVINSLWKGAYTSGYYTIEPANNSASTFITVGTAPSGGANNKATVYSNLTYSPLYHAGGIEYSGVHGDAYRSTYTGINSMYGVMGTAENNGTQGGTAAGVYGLATSTNNNVIKIGVYGDSYNTGFNDWAVYSNGPQFSTSSSFWSTSDERLKKDIQEYSGAIETIRQLNTKTYTYRNDGKFATINFAKNRQVGFIAQELEKVIPEMVTEAPLFFNKHDKDPNNDVTEKYKAVNYVYLIPVLTQAIKEQQAEIETQQKQIEALMATIAELKSSTGINDKAIDVKEGWISQNHPNPFTKQTIIDYKLPAGTKTASVGIYDLNGRQVKLYSLSSEPTGSVTVEGDSLQAGMYVYSLVVNGIPYQTKKMIIARD